MLLKAGRQLWSAMLLWWSRYNDIVDLVQNSICGHNVTLGDSSIFNLGTTIASNAQMLTRNGFNGAHERPIGRNDASTADNIVDNVCLNLCLQLSLSLCARFRFARLTELFEHIVLGHQQRKTIRFVRQQMSQVSLAHQLQEFAIVGIGLQRCEQVLKNSNTNIKWVT